MMDVESGCCPHHVKQVPPTKGFGQIRIEGVTHQFVCVIEVAVRNEQQRLSLHHGHRLAQEGQRLVNTLHSTAVHLIKKLR